MNNVPARLYDVVRTGNRSIFILEKSLSGEKEDEDARREVLHTGYLQAGNIRNV